MSPFTKFKFAIEREEVVEEVRPCVLGLCDGSGLVEREMIGWLPGLRLVKCECRKLIPML